MAGRSKKLKAAIEASPEYKAAATWHAVEEGAANPPATPDSSTTPFNSSEPPKSSEPSATSSVNPAAIVEQQLQYLQSRSEKGLLTEAEVQSFTALVKLQLILRARANADKGSDADFDDVSTEQLKAALNLL